MALNRTIKGLLVKQWTSMMVENSYRQVRDSYLRRAIRSYDSIRYVMDASQLWAETPQDRRYWLDIADNL